MVWVPLGVPLNEYWKSHYQLIRVYWESHWKSYSQVLLNVNPIKHIGNNWLSIRIRLDESYWTYHCISSDNLLKSLWESPFEMSHCRSRQSYWEFIENPFEKSHWERVLSRILSAVGDHQESYRMSPIINWVVTILLMIHWEYYREDQLCDNPNEGVI